MFTARKCFKRGPDIGEASSIDALIVDIAVGKRWLNQYESERESRMARWLNTVQMVCADDAFSEPEAYEHLETRDIGYAIRLSANWEIPAKIARGQK